MNNLSSLKRVLPFLLLIFMANINKKHRHMLFEDNTGIFKDIRFWLLVIALTILLTLVGRSYLMGVW